MCRYSKGLSRPQRCPARGVLGGRSRAEPARPAEQAHGKVGRDRREEEVLVRVAAPVRHDGARRAKGRRELRHRLHEPRHPLTG